MARMDSPGRKGSLSVCMIVRNEEAMLPDCLASVRSVASQIIVVDTGSTDSTIRIAESYGATVIRVPWENDFAKARNVALAHASGAWILSIDADERLRNPEALRSLLDSAPDDLHGYLADVVSTSTTGTKTTRFSSQLLRLFRNDERIRFYGIIHEQVVECLARNGLRFASSAVELEHLGYDLPPEKMRAKQIRNITLLDEAVRAHPHDAYLVHQRARTHLALGELEQAERDTQIALTLAEKGGVVRPQTLNYGALIAYRQGRHDVAIERAKESLGLVPYQAHTSYVLGESLTALGRFSEAFVAYSDVIAAQQKNDLQARIVGAMTVPESDVAFACGRSLIGMGKHAEAKQFFEIGLTTDPRSDACLVGLANCAYHAKEYDTACRHLLAAKEIAPRRTDIGVFLEQMRNTQTEDYLRSFTRGMSTAASSSQDPSSSSLEPSPTDSPMRPFLSLCMIVKNEEHSLRECLESVRGVADEIVIVDTGSTESTIAIAQEFNAAVGHFAWIGDFAAARNEALKMCTGEWILYLDADERLTDASRAGLPTLLRSLPASAGAAMCTIISPHRQKDDSTEVHRGGYPRIFRNYGYPRVHFRGRVHEQITPSILECGGELVNTDITILHTGYDIDREEMERKVQRNYELLIKHVQEEPLNAYAWFQLGQTLGRMNVADKAEEALRFALEIGTLSKPIAATAAATLAHICGTQSRYEDALMWSERSLGFVPNQAMALNYRAYSLLHLRRLDEAEEAFHALQHLLADSSLLPDTGYEVHIGPEIINNGLSRIKELRGGHAIA
ncbi:MAG: glycosyltransferase [Candidatus Kapaibacterium sp.]